MSKRYSIAEARANLPSLIDAAVAGADVELTRRGTPVAVVLSLEHYERLRGKHLGFTSAYREFLKKHPVKEVGVKSGFWKGVRDRSPGRAVKL